MLVPGTFVDRYELVSPVGEGGMAQVWIARQRGKHGFEKLFAFKCIHPRFAAEPAFRSMFLDEARIAASIEHPNVAQVFDLGESESMLYLVMEYVDGESLGGLMTAMSRRANQSVPVPTGIALRIIADTCAGLHAAHSLKDAAGNPRGVVHRDVSPQNVLVSVRGDVKVIDFGIAHAKDRIGSDTQAGSLKGKLHYMAPEQALRQAVGPFSDVFSTGATLYRMLAGHPPYDGGNEAATLNLLLSGAAPTPLPAHVPPLVAAIVERALAHDPGDRYASAVSMQTAIEAAIMEEGYVADVATWVMAGLSDGAKERRSELAKRVPNIAPDAVAGGALAPVEIPAFVAELAPARERETPPVPGAARSPAPAPVAQAAPMQGVPAARAVAIAPIGLPPEESSGPGMLDVRALVARANNPSAPAVEAPPPRAPKRSGLALSDDPSNRTPAPPPRPTGDRAEAEGAAAPARDGPAYVGPATKAVGAAGTRGAGWTKLAIIAVVLILVLVVVLLFLPRIVHDRVVASAREAGIELTIERVGIGFGGVSLRNVTAKAHTVPGAELKAEEIYAVGFSGREVRIRGIDVKIEGPASDVVPSLLLLYELNRGRLAGGGGDARKVAIVAAHVTWNGWLGEGTRLEAGEVGTDFESRAAGAEEIRANVGRFELKTKRSLFGPWASTFERNATTSRFRLLFDPPVPDGPSALLVWGTGTAPHLTVKVPRSPIARLGVRASELGLPADPGTEVEVKMEGGRGPTTRTEGTARINVYGVRLRGLSGPVDVKIEGGANGLPGKPLELEKTSVTVGPFVANVTGMIAPTDAGFRLDAAWRTLPVSCEKLARAEAKSMGPIAAAIQDIAHATGAARVTGTANASGVVQYDTKSPDEVSMTLVTREACGLSLFGL